MPIMGGGAALALAERKLGLQFNPYMACNFFIEIEGMVVAGFTEISGLEAKTEVETIQEGGVNNYQYKLPKSTSYGNLLLKYGVGSIDLIWGWYGDVINGTINRKNASIYLLDEQGLPALWWNIFDAWPISWNGPGFEAKTANVAIDSLTLAYRYLERSLASQAYAATKGLSGL